MVLTVEREYTKNLLMTGAPVTTHRYWRVFAENNNGGGFIGTNSQLEMHESVYSGPTVLTGGTISASSEFSGSFAATKALAGTWGSDNRWASTGPTNAWLKYDFGVGVAKKIVSIGAFGCASGTFDQNWKDIRVEYSDDDSNWTSYWTASQVFTASLQFKRAVKTSEVPSYTGSPYGSHTYWRVIVQLGNSGAISAAELEFRATPGGADQATGGTPSVVSTLIGSAADIFDNNNSTFWAINGSAEAWIKYQFASPVSVGEVAWRIRGDSNPGHSPASFLIQFSDDNTLWTTAWQVTGQTGWSNGEQRVFTSPDYV